MHGRNRRLNTPVGACTLTLETRFKRSLKAYFFMYRDGICYGGGAGRRCKHGVKLSSDDLMSAAFPDNVISVLA